MKKLIYVFVALLMVTTISGCGARQKTVRFNNGTSNEETATATETESVEGNEEVSDTDADSELQETILEEGETESDVVIETPNETTSAPSGKLSVTSLEGAYLKTNLSYNVIKGTAPSDTYKITINGYGLTKYIPGQTQWDYIASTRFSTLSAGTNNYVLKSFDKDGEETGSIMFTIDYEAPAIPTELPSVGFSHWFTLLFTLILSGVYAITRKKRWL